MSERIASARGPLIVSAVVAVLFRWPAYGMPWDRDASVYAVIGRFQGLPYRDFYDHKQPLVYPVYGLIDVLHVSPRLVSALVSVAAAALVFALLRNALAAVLIAVIGASRFVHGFDLNTEHLLLVTGTAPIVLALLQPRRVVLVGVLCGLAILTKAVAVLLLPAVLIALGWRAWPRLAAGVAVPLVLLAVVYLAAGAFDDLWMWNVTYNREYASVIGFGDRISRLKGQWPNVLLIVAAAVAAVALLREKRSTLHVTLSVWLAGAALGALAGGYAYAHYFVPVLVPAAALIALSPRPLLYLLLLAVIPFAAEDVRSLVQGSDRLAQRVYGGNVAVWEAAEPVGKLIKQQARPGDTMFVAGSEAGFYQYARVKPASPLLYDSILTLEPSLTPDLCSAPPRFLVLPHGTLPAYAQCLKGYKPLPGVPSPVQVLEQ